MENSVTIYISQDYNEKDSEILGIHNGDISRLLEQLAEHRDDLNNACTLAFSFEIMFNLLSASTISYRTEDAFFNGNVIHVVDQNAFCKLCQCEYNDKSIANAWLSVLKEISEDIDTLECRYGEEGKGLFLRSLLVYFSQFEIVTKLRN